MHLYSTHFLHAGYGLFLFWFIFKGAIINLGREAFSKEKKIEDLKIGDVVDEKVYEEYADKIPGGMDTINKIINFKN